MQKSDYPAWDLDLDIAAFKWPAKSPRANILLQHGLGEYSTRYVHQYSEIIPRLNELGFNVYAIDLPGHGFTPGIRGLVDVNEGVKLHLKARAAIGKELPLFLLGHSLGGLVTIGSIMEQQEGLAGAVVSSSAMQKPSSAFERVLSKIMATVAPSGPMPLPRPGLEALSRDQAVVDAAAVDPMFYQGKARNLVARTTLEVSDRVWEWARNWTLPALFVHGDKDTSTDHKNSITLFDKIASTDKSLKIYPGGYHELLNDLPKQEVLKEILDWLDQRAPRV